jgi:HlyD family secretion protein
MNPERASQNDKWAVRGPLIFGYAVVFLLIGGFGVWSATTTISGAVIAHGQIQVDQNRQVVQHPDGGVVDEVLVREGDTVEEGDILIRLDSENLTSELAVVEGQLFEILARRGRMEAERDGATEIVFPDTLLESDNPIVAELTTGQENLFEARLDTEFQQREQLSRRKEQIVSQIEGFQAQQTALDTQLELLNQELADLQNLLAQGLAQASRVRALEREAANLAGQAGELTAAVAQAEGRMTEIDIQITQLTVSRREEAITRLRDLQFNEIELTEQRRTLQQRLERLDIRAPVSGIVYGLTVFGPRMVIRPADPVLYIIPQDRPLIIAAQVPTIHVDQIHVGQETHLRFSAFDQRRTPELMGHVTVISADSFVDQATRASYYRVELVLEEAQLDLLPDDLTILPGMPVEAYFRTADRSPLSYLVKPMMDYFAKAFREG